MKKIALVFFLILVSTSANSGGLFSGCYSSGFGTNVPPYRSDTIAYIERVEADGGTVINVEMVDAAYQMLADNSLSPLVWVDANFGVKKDGSNYVSKLYDLSSNNHDATQSTATTYPVWTANQQNGLASIVYDGSNDDLTFGTQLGKPAAYTISAVVSTATVTTVKAAYGNRLSDGSATPWGIGGYRNTANGDLFSGFSKESTTSFTKGYTAGSLVTANVYHLRTDKYESGNTMSLYLNTVSKSLTYNPQAASENTGTSYDFKLGRQGDGSIYFQGGIASFVCFGSALSDANRGAVATFMNSNYAIY